MDFRLVIVVLLAYFIRPQDWVAGMSGTNIMKPLMALALMAMFTRRRGFTLGSLVRSPLDWAMLAYAIYIIGAAPEGERPVSAVAVLAAYYFVTAQALNTPRRLQVFLKVWFWAILTVAAMAVASEYGLDLTGARDLTHQIPEQPRLVLNTYLFNNPNSLGHTVVLAVPLAYFVLFWRRPAGKKLLAVGAALLAAYCVYLTKSKGAYIAGFAVLVVSQIFGRARIFQLIGVLLAVTLGWGALSQLPRMTELDAIRQDEAIMGRMLAWEQARIVSREMPSGQGFKTFQAMIEFDGEEIFKATHSSYVLVGAELGTVGMFFFVAVLYACGRALINARCRRESDERSRRILFVLLAGFMISGWLIDRSYHLEFFLLAGAVAALHRRLGIEAGAIEPEGELGDDPAEDPDADAGFAASDEPFYPGGGVLAPEPLRPALAGPAPGTFQGPALAYSDGSRAAQAAQAPRGGPLPPAHDTVRGLEDVDTSLIVEEAIEEEIARARYWRRITVVDLLLMFACSKAVIWLWDHMLESYFP